MFSSIVQLWGIGATYLATEDWCSLQKINSGSFAKINQMVLWVNESKNWAKKMSNEIDQTVSISV